MQPSEFALTIHKRLLDTYGIPEWRNPVSPLDELVSTILSQNTNDTNRDRAFKSLKARFPTWEAVRDADEHEVIGSIRTAGLSNQKGPRIQNMLREITAQRGELELDFLENLSTVEASNWLRSFKGVGPKTAAIVLQFSLGKPAFPVDTHIYRVTGRLGLRPQKMNADRAHSYLAELFPPQSYYAVHLNIIRLGREVCHARRPGCEFCPLNDLCEYYNTKSSEKMAGALLNHNHREKGQYGNR
ncbi:MAG: endonuclease III [Anaerolineales bacterium]